MTEERELRMCINLRSNGYVYGFFEEKIAVNFLGKHEWLQCGSIAMNSRGFEKFQNALENVMDFYEEQDLQKG